MRILAIDPGTTESAWVHLIDGNIANYRKQPNQELLANIIMGFRHSADKIVIEQIKSYGMAVGEEVFETVYWSGIFAQAAGLNRVKRLPRMAVKMHLCHSPKANDSNIRQALIDRFGAPGTKKNPGGTYGISGDIWAALAVAVTWWDQNAVTT